MDKRATWPSFTTRGDPPTFAGTGNLTVCEIDWGAIATFAAGLLAVGAALHVGTKQNRILVRQANLAAAAINENLFEKRYAVYSAAKEYLLYIVQHDKEPPRELEMKFAVNMMESQFLFSKIIHDWMSQVWRDTFDLFKIKAQMRSELIHNGDYSEQAVAKELELIFKCSEHFDALLEKFLPEMQLSFDNLYMD